MTAIKTFALILGIFLGATTIRAEVDPWIYLTWQRDPTTTMTISWLGAAGCSTTLQWRKKGAEGWQTSEGTSAPFPHTAKTLTQTELAGLEPDCTYEFRLGQGGVVRRFRTLPAKLARPLTFIEGGDTQNGPVLEPMMRMVASRNPAFAVIGGDLTNDDGKPEAAPWVMRFFQSIHENLVTPDGRMIPVVVCVGNHDLSRKNQHRLNEAELPSTSAERRETAPFFLAAWPFPGERGHGVLDVGDYLSLVLLDTNHFNAVDGPQANWLREVLDARRGIPHLFPVYHVPAYPGVRDMQDELSRRIRETWCPLFEQAGVEVAFEHHEHALKVTQPMRGGRIVEDGVVYLGGGAWAAELRNPRSPEDEPHLAKTMKVHHVFEVILKPEGRKVRALDLEGKEIYRLGP
jgi:hypothetical protein